MADHDRQPRERGISGRRTQDNEFEARRITDHEIGLFVWANVVDEFGSTVVRCDSRLSGVAVEPGTVNASFKITIRTPWLRPGRYFVDLYLLNFGLYDGWEQACTFEVLPLLPYKHTPQKRP